MIFARDSNRYISWLDDLLGPVSGPDVDGVCSLIMIIRYIMNVRCHRSEPARDATRIFAWQWRKIRKVSWQLRRCVQVNIPSDRVDADLTLLESGIGRRVRRCHQPH